MDFFSNSATLIISTLGGLYLGAVLLRLLLQIARADFYNPLSQAVVQLTDPLVRPLRGLIPSYKNIDLACVVLAICVHALAICALILSYGSQIPSAGLVLTWAIVGTLLVIIKIYYYAILGSIIMSFVMMFSGSMNPHPMLLLIWQLTEPIMAPVRQIIPPLGGLDLSPILIFLIIRLLQDFFIGTFDLGRYSAVILGL